MRAAVLQGGFFVVDEVDMSFVSYYTRQEFALTARLLGTGQLDPGPFVTERVGLHELDRIFDTLGRPSDQRKVLIVP